jgi:hypothetical protein
MTKALVAEMVESRRSSRILGIPLGAFSEREVAWSGKSLESQHRPEEEIFAARQQRRKIITEHDEISRILDW